MAYKVEVHITSYNGGVQGNELEKTLKGEVLEKIVDEDIDNFAKFFCGKLKNDSLAGPERAIIKTYLWWKTHQEDPRV